MERYGEHFIHKKDKELHDSDAVKHEQKRLEFSSKRRNKNSPEVKLANFFEVLKRTHEGHSKDSLVFERIRKYYHNNYLIKPEDIDNSVFLLEQRIARELGYGDIDITEEFKKRKIQEIIEDQKHSLDLWLDYLSSPDAMYPMWAKYFAFTSLLKMGKFEKKIDENTGKETMVFLRRNKNTISPFPPFNAGALAQTIGAIENKAKHNINKRTLLTNTSSKLSDEDYLKLINTENFSSIYAQFLMEAPEYSEDSLENIEGEWVKYKKGSDPDQLVRSLEGHPLEWCTRNKETARNQLAGGDFYVYYSNDKEGNPKIPRVAIRMQGNNIAEVRGIAQSQNIDPYITPVIENKMKDFPDAEKYRKKSIDMKKLTEIEKRFKITNNLTTDDLRFLYEIDAKIEGFGQDKDPRIKEILKGRDLRTDLSTIFNCKPSEISTSTTEFLKGNNRIIYHYGNLDLSGLETAKDLVLPSPFNGNLNLRGLKTAKDLVLPSPFNGNLDLSGLKTAKDLVLPSQFNGNLYLNGLETAKDLVIPSPFNGDLNLRGLKTAKDLVLPSQFNGYLDLSGLKTAKDLVLPSQFNGYLDLSGLETAKDLVLPSLFNGNLNLRGLKTAKDLVLPSLFNGELDLGGLETAKDLVFPSQFNGELDLGGLETAKDLVLPSLFNGNLYLNGLETAMDLVIPSPFNGDLYLHNLNEKEKKELKSRYPKINIS